MKFKVSELLEFQDKFDAKELYSKLPSNEREWKTEVWLKHPDERLTNFKDFVEYYLPIPRQYRSVRLAFHLKIYLNPLVEGMSWDEAKTKSPSGNWYMVSRGEATFADADRDIHPKKVIVPMNWNQRANAYDKVKRRVQLSEFFDLRNRIIKEEAEYAVDALDLFDKMFTAWREDMLKRGVLYILDDDDNDTTSRLVKRARDEQITIKEIKELRDITEVRDTITRYARRALRMPSVVKEDAWDTSDNEIQVQFINDWGLASATGGAGILTDDITTEELLKELEKKKSTK